MGSAPVHIGSPTMGGLPVPRQSPPSPVHNSAGLMSSGKGSDDFPSLSVVVRVRAVNNIPFSDSDRC